MTRIREIILVVLTAAIVFFAFQNFATVEVAFLIWRFTVPLALIALVPLLAGLVIGGASMAVRMRRRRRAAEPELLEAPEVEPGPDAEEALAIEQEKAG